MRISRKALKTMGMAVYIQHFLFHLTEHTLNLVHKSSSSLSVDYCLSISVWCRELGQYWSPISKGANFFAHYRKNWGRGSSRSRWKKVEKEGLDFNCCCVLVGVLHVLLNDPQVVLVGGHRICEGFFKALPQMFQEKGKKEIILLGALHIRAFQRVLILL